MSRYIERYFDAGLLLYGPPPFDYDGTDWWGCEITDTETGLIGSSVWRRPSKSSARYFAWEDLKQKQDNYYKKQKRQDETPRKQTSSYGTSQESNPAVGCIALAIIIAIVVYIISITTESTSTRQSAVNIQPERSDVQVDNPNNSTVYQKIEIIPPTRPTELSKDTNIQEKYTVEGCQYGDCINGYGRLVSKEGKYDGLFINGRFAGCSTFEWNEGFSDKKEYYGNYSNGIMEGAGKLVYWNGNSYLGDFKNGEPHGGGTLTYKSGNYYVGSFGNGKADGLGGYRNLDGSGSIGQFRNNRLFEGKRTFNDGFTQFTIEYINGKAYGTEDADYEYINQNEAIERDCNRSTLLKLKLRKEQ